MRLLLDGHRLTRPEVAALLEALGWQDVAAGFQRDGYTLRPIRAPRRMPHNRVTFRLCWTCRQQDAVLIVRMNATVDAARV